MTPYNGPTLVAPQGSPIWPSAMCTARVLINDIVHHIELIVLSECSHPLISGWDFLSSAFAAICCGQRVVHLSETDHILGEELYKPLRLIAA